MLGVVVSPCAICVSACCVTMLRSPRCTKGSVVLDVEMANPLRGEVVKLYKNLLFLGREYPKGEVFFKERLKKAFLKNKDVSDPEKIRELIARGEFVIKELEALYYLRKYRAMKQRYYEDGPGAQPGDSQTLQKEDGAKSQ